jgi:hypothetical protein
VLKTCKRAGCEGLTIEFDALAVIDTPEMRQHLTAMVREAHDLGVRVCGHVILEPRYSSIPTLVDVSATFGLDDVRFSVEADAAPPQLPLGQLLDLAQSHYRTLRRRQFFINRFGSYLGPMMWRVGQIGLLGPTWQRYAIDDAG